MESKGVFTGSGSRVEPPVNTARGQRELEMQKKMNGAEANELATQYLLHRGGISAS